MKKVFFNCLLILSISFCYSQNYPNKKLSKKDQKSWEKYLTRVEESKVLKALKDSIANNSTAANINSEFVDCSNPKLIPPKFPNCLTEVILSDIECFKNEVNWHVKRHFNYPEFARYFNIQGRVNVTYEINEEGNIEIMDVKGPENRLILEEEVTKFMSKLPKIEPAYQCDKPVRVRYSISINFKLG